MIGSLPNNEDASNGYAHSNDSLKLFCESMCMCVCNITYVLISFHHLSPSSCFLIHLAYVFIEQWGHGI